MPVGGERHGPDGPQCSRRVAGRVVSKGVEDEHCEPFEVGLAPHRSAEAEPAERRRPPAGSLRRPGLPGRPRRKPDAFGLQHHTAQLSAGTKTRGQLVYELTQTPGFQAIRPDVAQLSEEEFVRLTYPVILNRKANPDEVSFNASHIRAGKMTRCTCSTRCTTRAEFRETSWGGMDFWLVMHRARLLVAASLPKAERIVDLGGSSEGNPCGALVMYGYPYHFKSLTIVELPRELRHELYTEICGEYTEVIPTPQGPVNYVYASMSDLSAFADASVDLVYAGQSIEHVPVEEAKTVLREVHRVLKPGGHFCFDTPNRKVTILQFPNYVVDDHKYEYTHQEMTELLEGHGFAVREAKGMALMDQSVREGRFIEARSWAATGSTTTSRTASSFITRPRRSDHSPGRGPGTGGPAAAPGPRRAPGLFPAACVRPAPAGGSALASSSQSPRRPHESRLSEVTLVMNGPLRRFVSFFSARPAEPLPAATRPWVDAYETFTVKLEGGTSFDLVFDAGTQDPVVRGYIEGYRPNEFITEQLTRFTRPGDCVLDLGAHVGTFSLTASALGRRVIAVDASPKHVELLRRSVSKNGFDRMEVVHTAVGERSGSVRFHVAGLWGMIARDGPGLPEVRDAPVVEVPIVRGEALLKRLGQTRVDFLKMDIEGSEVSALRGLKSLLKRDDAPAIVFECNALTLHEFGFTTADLLRTLEGFGYRSYRPEHGRFRAFPAGDFQPEIYLDLLALKPRHEAVVAAEIDPPLGREEMILRTLDEAGRDHEAARTVVARSLAGCRPRSSTTRGSRPPSNDSRETPSTPSAWPRGGGRHGRSGPPERRAAGGDRPLPQDEGVPCSSTHSSSPTSSRRSSRPTGSCATTTAGRTSCCSPRAISSTPAGTRSSSRCWSSRR